MQAPRERGGAPNPHDLSLHKQVKDIGDMLRPELLRLHKCPTENNGNISLYVSFIEEIKLVKKEMTNHDAICAFHNILNHMQKAIEISQKNGVNQEILWHLQEVMSLLFKVQSMPS